LRFHLREAWRRRRGAAPQDAPPAEPLESLAPADREIIERVWPFTMTSVERLAALIDGVRYCVKRNVAGAIVECGVWLGGSVLAVLLTLQELGADDRRVYLYDTFQGMTRPTEHDVSRHEPPALEGWNEKSGRMTNAWWAGYFDPDVLNLEAVREVVLSSGYEERLLHFVQGPVEKTLPKTTPDRLALLRLDTDWYESTRHELVHLYPRLVEGGVLIVDDYGHWEGCRRAVDEYFATEADPILLSRVDYTARIAIKR
jgi:O-methyltransferase